MPVHPVTLKSIFAMKPSFTLGKVLGLGLVVALGFGAIPATATENVHDAIELVRTLQQSNRRDTVTASMQFTAEEAAAFWPFYEAYRTDMDKLGDQLVKLILEYGDHYPDLPEERASVLLKECLSLEEKLVRKRAWYLKRAKKFLPASKILRWAQVENRLDLVLRLQLAGSIPLAPTAESKP